jgi:peptide/nickel transport system permease protein
VIAFIIQRLAHAVVILLLVSMIGFSILHLAPGGPMALVAGGDMTAGDIKRLEEQLGLDRALPIQYFDWVVRSLQGDWGRSYRDNQPVLSLIFARLGATFELMACAMLLAILIGSTIGATAAIRRHSFFDIASTVGAMVLVSIPTFWFGFVVIYLFSVKLAWLPAGNRSMVGNDSLLDHLRHLVAPVIVLAMVSMAQWSRYMRASTIEVLDQDFVRTARSKGVAEWRVITKHVMRNAVLPMVTIAGLQLPSLLGGALVTETVFTWPGMGRLFLDSISYRDYPTIMGILMFSATLVLIGSLLADMLYSVADPRVRLS